MTACRGVVSSVVSNVVKRVANRVVSGALAAVLCAASAGIAQPVQNTAPPIAVPGGLPVLPAATQARMDRDLLEVTIPQLHALYRSHRYTVEQVVRWQLGRIARYNALYKPVQTVDLEGALHTARAQDAAGPNAAHGPLWGVPLFIKANTAVRGLPDTDGWRGFALPGHAFVAARDATVVARLRAAGAVILGITNMPDFAASDTNRSTVFGRTGNAYDVRFSPGGSSGGTVTALTANMAVLGTGTDTANSIRMPAGTSSVVGVLPTRGLVSIAGIAPLDWLLDNTGPIARTVTDAAIALEVMAGGDGVHPAVPADPLDFRTVGSGRTPGFELAQLGPYLPYLGPGALREKRFGVPAFILNGSSGFGVSIPDTPKESMEPTTRAMFLQSLDRMRSAGAVIVTDAALLPESFTALVRKGTTRPYRLDGTNGWLAQFGPGEYQSAAAYEKSVGKPLPGTLTGNFDAPAGAAASTSPALSPVPQRVLATDPEADAQWFAPQRAALAAYLEAMEQFHLDGFVYPSAYMEPPDETLPQDGQLSEGPHSQTGWVNRIGVPAVVVPAGYYPDGLPFGLELSARPWRDGDLLGYAFAFEQATKLRRMPVLVEQGLLPSAP